MALLQSNFKSGSHVYLYIIGRIDSEQMLDGEKR